MKLFTQIPVVKQTPKIDYLSSVVSVGSCFAVNMAAKFDYFKFRSTVNPFGILFQPLAIEKLIGFATNNTPVDESSVFFLNERWHCFDTHSDLSSQTSAELLDTVNGAIQVTKARLTEASHIIITLGTAWVYRYKSSGNLVANCHKVPQKEFVKELLAIDEIAQSLTSTIHQVRELNPSAEIILTISPIRHIKDGFVENQRSKAHLIAAVHKVIDQNSGNEKVSYFPSYEIVMDELRDYRFYAEDLIHPNQMAIDYIWEKFADAWIADESRAVMDEVDAIQKAMAHRPFNPDSDSHREFKRKTEERAAALQTRFPNIGF